MSLSVQLQALSGQSSYQTRARSYTPVDGIVTVAPPSADDIADLLNMGCAPMGTPLATDSAAGIVKPDGVGIDIDDSGTLTLANDFLPQPAAASGGPVVTTTPTLTAYGYTLAQAEAILTLLNNIQAALVANGIMS